MMGCPPLVRTGLGLLFVVSVLVACADNSEPRGPGPDAGLTVPVDGDRDGVAKGEDCDDGDRSLGARALDGDCDGSLRGDDCDDADPQSTTKAQDGDCDGIVEADDCDDGDPQSTRRAEDQDCDGYDQDEDCNDEDASIYPGAEEDWDDGIDQDCDGNEDSICGDGKIGNIEGCDDGNERDGDGCSAVCAIEPQCTAGCLENADCDPLACIGIPRRVDGATGQCVDLQASPAGRDEPCSLENPCGPELACLGASIWEQGAWCVPQWFAKNFYSHDDQVIPEDGSRYSSTVVACGLASVPVDIVVYLHLDHPRPQDLLVQLEDPNGQIGSVLDHEVWVPGPIVARVGSGDDTVNGEWTLHISDTVNGERGTLTGWSVYLMSRWD